MVRTHLLQQKPIFKESSKRLRGWKHLRIEAKKVSSRVLLPVALVDQTIYPNPALSPSQLNSKMCAPTTIASK